MRGDCYQEYAKFKEVSRQIPLYLSISKILSEYTIQIYHEYISAVLNI